MRITWLWALIWDGSISENVCLTEVSKPVKFHAFIMKRTIEPIFWSLAAGLLALYRRNCRTNIL